MVLILTKEDDEHLSYVTDELDKRKTEWVRFNPGCFPASSEIRLEYERNRGLSKRTLKVDGRSVDLASVSGVWYRRPDRPQAGSDVEDPVIREWVTRESLHVLGGLWETLHCTWVPGKPADTARAERKVYQLEIAAQLGFSIPRTIIGNSPEGFSSIYQQSGGKIVTKTSEQAFVSGGTEYVTGFTRMVGRPDLADLPSLRLAPVITQEYIPKRFELRITVVGSKVFAAEIHSQDNPSTQYDWRRYDLDRTPHKPHQLPSTVERLCLELVRTLRLTFGAIDMILTPDGEYVFLEINPNGQWGWIAELAGLPIAEAITDVLVEGQATSPE